MRRGVAYGLVGLLAVALVACGGDDDDSAATTARATATTTSGTGVDTSSAGSGVSAADATEEDYLAAIVRSFTSGDESELQLTATQADCAAPKWLETIGVERLKEHGVTPDMIGDENDSDSSALSDLGLSEAEGNQLFDAFGDCDVDLQQEFVRSITAGNDLGEEVTSCLSDAIDEDLLRKLMVATITEGDDGLDEDSDLTSEFNAAIAPCQELADTTATTG